MAQSVRPTALRRTRRPVGRLVLGAVVGAVAVLVLLPDQLGLDGWVPFAALVALRPQLTIITVLVAVTLLVSRRARLAAAALLLVSLVSGALIVPRALVSASPSPRGPELTVFSFNVDQGGADVPALAASIRRERPDVVVLPEAAERYRALLAAVISDLGYRSFVAAAPGAPDVRGVSVFTAPSLGAPISRVIEQGGADPWLELTSGRLGALRLVAVHVSAPVPAKIDSWPRELTQLQSWCGPGAGPAVVVGDFNATLDHREFRDGAQGCEDAGAVTGQGLTATWDAAWPRWFGVQIDHVLSGGGQHPTDLQILDLPGSDHRALLARVRLS